MKTIRLFLILGALCLGVTSTFAQNFGFNGYTAAKKAADRDNERAMYELGRMYETGKLGAPMDKQKAFELIKKAAEAGHAKAQAYLGLLYKYGIGNQAGNKEQQALYWMKKSAAQECIMAYQHLSMHYGYTSREGRKWMAKGAEAGDAESQLNYAEYGDTQRMEYWLKKSAAQGLERAQGRLAEYYLDDKPKEAFKWYRRAALNNYPPAIAKVGMMYYNGQGTTINKKKAFKWLSRDTYDTRGKVSYYLGRLYYKGEGVPMDKAKGIQYLKKAVKKGNDDASKFLRELK